MYNNQQQQQQQQEEAQPANVAAGGGNVNTLHENATEMMLEVLNELRSNYMQLEQVVGTEVERTLAHNARTTIEEDIETMQMLQRQIQMHNEHTTDLATRLRVSDLHVRVLQILFQQARQGFGQRMSRRESAPGAGGDDGGIANQSMAQ